MSEKLSRTRHVSTNLHNHARIEHTSFKLHSSSHDVHEKLDDRIRGCQNFVEENESNHDRSLATEAKGIVQRVVVDEDREKSEHVEQVHLRDEKQLGCVSHLPVTQLVGENSLDLLGVRLLNQCIVNDNLLLPGQTGEVSIAVSTTLATIDDLQFRKGEVEALSKSFDSVLEWAGLERSKLVEQRDDGDRVDGDGEELDTESEQPKVVEKLVTSLLDNLQESPAERYAECERKRLSFEQVGYPQTDCLLVEAKLLLEDKVVVV